MADLLVVDIAEDDLVTVSFQREGDRAPDAAGSPVRWIPPLDAQALEDLRWYLEDYLRMPFGVYEERGPAIAEQLPQWGMQLFDSVFGAGPARDVFVAARSGGRPVELVFRSGNAAALGLPWELMRDGARPEALALENVAVSRMLPGWQLAEPFAAGGSRLRVLMVIARPQGPDRDVAYQMIARPLLPLLEQVRGAVDLVVLRPPTLARLGEVLAEAVRAGEPFQIVHFDGHGVFGNGAGPSSGWPSAMYNGPGPTGMLAFEKPGGGTDLVEAGKVARILADGKVPLVVLNACQSAQLGAQVEAAVATRLLQGGASSVVAMAYSVYAVAAAEFMAVFYRRLFAGDRVTDAVAAARHHLAAADLRPSPKGKLPLADWMVPVHYTRRDLSFPGLQAAGASEQRPVAEADGDDLDAVGEFVGRDGLLLTLESAARLNKVVVLHGPGGTGKTELAKGFGRWWRDTGGVEHPERVIWHSFEPGVASFGLSGVVNAVGLHVYGPDFVRRDEDERQREVEKVLREHRLLLIWDNFESVHTMPDPNGATPSLDKAELAKLRTFLERIRDHGASTVLITSRSREEWLGDIRHIEVGGLSPEEAVQYADRLLEPYPRAQVRRQQRAFAELMDWLDRHPLSMRVTLPRLDDTDPKTLLDGLRGITPLPGHYDGGRTTSLPACIAYSFTHLPEGNRDALAAVALFHGVADADVLGGFSETEGVPERFRRRDRQDWVQILDHAASVGLLTAIGANMYRIHPALPTFLADRWRSDSVADFNMQHAAATRALLEAFTVLCAWSEREITGGSAEFALTVIAHHRHTLGAMLAYALEHRLWVQAQIIAQPFTTFLDLQGLAEEARGWTDRARVVLEALDGTPPDLATPAGDLWMFLVGVEANRQISVGQFDQAARVYGQILSALQEQVSSSHGDKLIAAVHHQLGVLAQDRGRWDEAEDWYRKSLTVKERLGSRAGMASSYHQLGILAQKRGRWDEAEDWYRKSLTILEQLGDRASMAYGYHQLGRIAQDRGRWDEAEGWYRKSLTIEERLGSRAGMASSYHQLGILAQKRGRCDEAEDWFGKSLTIREQIGDRAGIARNYQAFGVLASNRGHWAEAEDWFRHSITICDQLGDRSTMADNYRNLGILAEKRGRWDAAEDLYRKTLTIFELLGDRLGMARIYATLGLLADAQGQSRQALAWTVRCVALFDQIPHPATSLGARNLKLLTANLGLDTLEDVWHQVTGSPLPAAVRDFVQSPDDPSPTAGGNPA